MGAEVPAFQQSNSVRTNSGASFVVLRAPQDPLEFPHNGPHGRIGMAHDGQNEDDRGHGARDEQARHVADRGQTGTHGLAVQVDGTGAALAAATALLRPGQSQVVAQHVQQPAIRQDLCGVISAVDAEREL